MISIKCFRGGDAVSTLQHGDIERASAQVVGQDKEWIGGITDRIGKRGGGWLHHHLFGNGHIETCSFSRLASFSDLIEIEIRRVSDDRPLNRLTQRVFCALLEV